MKKTRLVLFVLFLAILGSCKMDLRGVLYVNDILESVESPESLFCPATIAIEYPGDDSQEAVATLFKTYFSGTENIRKEEVDGSDCMVADIKIPFVKDKDSVAEDSLFSFIVAADGKGKIDVLLALDREAFANLSKEAEDISYSKLNLSDMAFTFTLNNDSRSKVRFETTSVYANKKAYPYKTVLDLDRRQIVNLKLSDVLRDQFAQEDSILLASLVK